MDSCTTCCPGLVFGKVIKTTYPAGYSESSAYSNLNLDIATPKKITTITISIPTPFTIPRPPDRNTACHKKSRPCDLLRTGLPSSSSAKISVLNPGGRLMESREPESMDGWWRVLWILWPGMPLWLWKKPWSSGISRLLFISHWLRSLTGSICIVFLKTNDIL